MPDPISPAPVAPPVVPPVAPPVAKWYDGQAAEIIGHIQSKGWHDKPANEVAIAAVTAYREAEKYIGHPADSIIRLPKDAADQAGWSSVWSKLGAVKDATEVDLSAVKGADGAAFEARAADLVKNAAVKFHLTKDAARELAQDLAKHFDAAKANDLAEAQGKVALEKDALSKLWTSNEAANRIVAQNAARVLGIELDAINALESVVGYAKVMEMFRQIGTKIGEDRFISGGNGPNPGVMTTDQAKSRLDELKNDRDWTARYLNGGVAEKREFQNLTRLIAGV